MDVVMPSCCRMRDSKCSAPAHLTWPKLGFVSSNKELMSTSKWVRSSPGEDEDRDGESHPQVSG